MLCWRQLELDTPWFHPQPFHSTFSRLIPAPRTTLSGFFFLFSPPRQSDKLKIKIFIKDSLKRWHIFRKLAHTHNFTRKKNRESFLSFFPSFVSEHKKTVDKVRKMRKNQKRERKSFGQTVSLFREGCFFLRAFEKAWLLRFHTDRVPCGLWSLTVGLSSTVKWKDPRFEAGKADWFLFRSFGFAERMESMKDVLLLLMENSEKKLSSSIY